MQSLDVTDTSEDTVYIVCLFNAFSTDSGCTVVLVYQLLINIVLTKSMCNSTQKYSKCIYCRLGP